MKFISIDEFKTSCTAMASTLILVYVVSKLHPIPIDTYLWVGVTMFVVAVIIGVAQKLVGQPWFKIEHPDEILKKFNK